MEIAVKQKVNEIFAPLWEEKARYYICMGGRGAGRSTAGSQFALSKIIAPEFTRGALMRAVQSDIRHSIWRELIDRVEEQGIKEAIHIIDSDLYLNYGENSFKGHGFKASSGSLTARLKSLANYNIIVIEEAEEIGAEEFRTLDDSLRTVKGDIHIVLLLNPPHKNHWIIEKWFDLDEVEGVPGFYIPKLKSGTTDTVFVKGNYLDNIKNLDKHTVKRYNDYRKTNPSYFYQMIMGYIPEVVRGKIYNGWELIDELSKEAKLLRIGGDWGWYPDPVATIALYYLDGYYIVDGITYGNNIEDDIVASDIRNIDPDGQVRAVFGADEPKSIALMEDKGINAVKSIFGPGSVKTRIKMTAEKRIKVVRKNHPIHGNWVWDCYEKYHWAEDKDGNPKGEPDHEGSDPMDAISYAIADLTEKVKKETYVHKPGITNNSRVSINKSSIGYSRFR